MKRFHAQKPLSGPEIDDITWADLNMDAIFKRVKNTQSSVGDEYSYRFFRQQHNDDLEHFEQAVQAMADAPGERRKLQFAFHQIGRKTNNGLIDLILHPENFPKIPMLAIVLVTLVDIAGLVWLNYDMDYGILAVTLGFCAALILFGIVISKITTAMVTLGMFTRMVRAAKLFVKLDIPAFHKETSIMKENLRVFQSITSLVDFIIQSSSMGGNILVVFIAYFGLYGFAYHAMVKLFRKHHAQALVLYETIGYVELCISTASYRESLDYYCNPTFSNNTTIEFEEIIHPLLKRPVPNTHSMGNKLLITGSNASGKSTFARTLAVNAILGQLLNTCLAKRYAFRPCDVLSSMNLKDDITVGDSFYVAEVKSLKRLLEVAATPRYSMLFLDEIFKGTNMVERIAAASVILKRFVDADCFICLATHDLELCRIMGDRYENYHFQELIEYNEICFDYKLRDGVTTGSNAIRLLAHCKYDPGIVAEAEAAAEHYRASGEWDVQ